MPIYRESDDSYVTLQTTKFRAMQPPAVVQGDFFVGTETEFQQWLTTTTKYLASEQVDPRVAKQTQKEQKTHAQVVIAAGQHLAGIVPYLIDFSSSFFSLTTTIQKANSSTKDSAITLLSLNMLMESFLYGAPLVELYLANNKIGDEGALVISKSLAKFPHLTTLYLSGNQVANRGACVLASSLQRNTSVTTLDLYMNRVGDSGATALARMLETNITLSVLNLKGNLIGTHGSKALATAMAKNASIQSLTIDDNNASDKQVIDSIIHSLGVNTDPKQNIKLHFKKLKHMHRIDDMRPDIRAFVNKKEFSDLSLHSADDVSHFAHKAILLGRSPQLYQKWCPSMSQADLVTRMTLTLVPALDTSVVRVPLSSKALQCLLEHIYGLELLFLDLSNDDAQALLQFARANNLKTLSGVLIDALPLENVSAYTLSQEALLSQPELSDVALIAADNPTPIQVHRVVLAARSQYFFALFTSGLKETTESQVSLAKPRALIASVVEFCYTGDVAVIDSSIAIDLLLASLEYRLSGLQAMVESMVADAVDAENLSDLTALAEEQNLDVLAVGCRLFAATNHTTDPPSSNEQQQQQQQEQQPPPQPNPNPNPPPAWVPRENASIRQTCIVQ